MHGKKLKTRKRHRQPGNWLDFQLGLKKGGEDSKPVVVICMPQEAEAGDLGG